MARLVCLFTILCCQLVSAATYLQIQHPQQTWRYCRGEITEATLSIRPQGLYMEYGLYLTMAASPSYFSSQDAVEIQFYFDLSSQAIMHDLWLWVDGKIMRGQIMDRWQASNVYEGIVNRRRDPAILFKDASGRYQLRVYPLVGGSNRRVKITWLQPTEWNEAAASAELPHDLIKVSNTILPRLQLMFWPDGKWWSPRIAEAPNLPFKTAVDSSGVSYSMALIPSYEYSKSLHISCDAPLQQGRYQGRMPFVLQASGMVGNQPFTRTITIAEKEVMAADTLLQELEHAKSLCLCFSQ